MADRGRPHVRVIAPARWAPDEVLSAFSQIAEAEGLSVEIDPQAKLRADQLAGSDDERAEALAAALGDDAVDIIWCARGGYGSARVLNGMSGKMVSGPKLLIGYSDMTALQLSGVLPGVTNLHGPMPIDAAKPGGGDRLSAAARLAKGLISDGQAPANAYDLEGVADGTVHGPLAIGNLCVLTTLLGTPYEPQWDGVILCLEDICEYYYALDRHFVHLAQSRAGQGVAGIVIGDFTDLEDNDVPWGEDVPAMVRRHFPDIPVACGLPIGHGDRNEALIQGAAATLSVTGGNARLDIEGFALAGGAS
ncbi:LD-carboxypeptidase [Parvularcula marina]|uniref:S66 peptidase family protein n=1 Tax=Parvularcula marina TaxID=2292771 RepID=UPI0035114A73